MGELDAMKILSNLNKRQDTDADIKHDPGGALYKILSLGVAIGQMDAAGNKNTSEAYAMALEAVNRIAGYYERRINR
jgi:hypothetical protein